jgi:sporulation protein YlmC with PRC-barrel domain
MQMALEENKYDRLHELSGSDFEIADEQPDITGWEIFDANGDYVGDVKDLLFDKESYKVRYIIANYEEDLDADKSRLILLPIGLATLHESDDEVILTEAIGANIPYLPTYQKGKLTPAHEAEIRDILTNNNAGTIELSTYEQHPDGFYDHTHFDDTGYKKYRTGRDGLNEGEII